MDLFHEISQYPDEVSGTTVLVRLLDGLGFRFRWATDGLSDADYGFRPAPDCMSIEELVRHIWGLVNWVCQSVETPRFGKQEDIELTRRSVLEMLQALRKALLSMGDDELGGVSIYERPFWHIINGPVADALTHVGQINSFRRLAGNPTPGANVFMGLPPEE